MADKPTVSGNGHGKWTIDISHWPWYAQYSWAIGAKFGIVAVLALAGAGIYGFWSYKVSMPEAQTRIELLKSQLDTNRRILDCMDKIVASEQMTVAWQMEWKAYITEQHALRAKEAQAILEYQETSKTFYERTDEVHAKQDKLHSQQIELMQGILDELRVIRAGLSKNVQPPQATLGAEPNN